MKRNIQLKGVFSVSKAAYTKEIKIKQGDNSYGLDEIIMAALGDEIPEGYNQKFAGTVKLSISLKGNSIYVLDEKTGIYSSLEMENKE